jgi:hypothetical protein
VVGSLAFSAGLYGVAGVASLRENPGNLCITPFALSLSKGLRVQNGLKTPDALQAACAMCLPGETIFVTGDLAFEKVAGLDVRLIAMPIPSSYERRP